MGVGFVCGYVDGMAGFVGVEFVKVLDLWVDCIGVHGCGACKQVCGRCGGF